MRERIEDLGRIAVMVEHLMKHELFNERPCRNKDFTDWFFKRTQDDQEEWLHTAIYQIAHVKELIDDLWEVATGQDYLNQPENP